MPYEEHQIFGQLDGEQDIWRYISFTKLVWIIQNSKLHFHRTGDFPDLYEGAVPRAVIGMRRNNLAKKLDKHDSDMGVEQVNTSFKELAIRESIEARSIAYVNSWYASEVESAAMWEKYRARGKPVCVKSSISGLIDSVAPIEDSVYIGKLVYVDHDAPLEQLENEDRRKLRNLYSRSELGNMLYPILSKRKEFSHERELRAVCVDTSPLRKMANSEDITHNDLEEIAKNHWDMKIDLASLIEKIFIGPDTPKWVANTIRGYVKDSELKLDPERDVCHSDLDRQPFDY